MKRIFKHLVGSTPESIVQAVNVEIVKHEPIKTLSHTIWPVKRPNDTGTEYHAHLVIETEAN